MKGKNSIIVTIVAVIVVGALAFFGGMQYQKSQAPKGFAQFSANGGGNRGFGNRQFGQRAGGAGGNAVMGDIVSTDNGSITVKMQDGSSKIVLLSGSTSINKQATGSQSDLKTGERVVVFGTANSDGSITAQNVAINPTFGGPRSTTVTPTPTK
ncbi:MAG TPA: hypothetical protein VG935_03530 [Patescibacteria group bacterium]|nr:hypothetical protein [Patescibacteria group bacterium]